MPSQEEQEQKPPYQLERPDGLDPDGLMTPAELQAGYDRLLEELEKLEGRKMETYADVLRALAERLDDSFSENRAEVSQELSQLIRSLGGIASVTEDSHGEMTHRLDIGKEKIWFNERETPDRIAAVINDRP